MDHVAFSSRPAWACARCRRQKLKVLSTPCNVSDDANDAIKCDAEKPCTLCVRAGAPCEPQIPTQNSALKRKSSTQLNSPVRARASASYVHVHAEEISTSPALGSVYDAAHSEGSPQGNDSSIGVPASTKPSP